MEFCKLFGRWLQKYTFNIVNYQCDWDKNNSAYARNYYISSMFVLYFIFVFIARANFISQIKYLILHRSRGSRKISIHLQISVCLCHLCALRRNRRNWLKNKFYDASILLNNNGMSNDML